MTQANIAGTGKKYMPRHAAKARRSKNFWLILIKCIGWLLLGAAAGYAFYYFFSDFTVAAIDRYKFLQSIFGISQYEQGAKYLNVVLAILVGNAISTAAYFTLGYFRTLIPLAIISGFFMVLLIFAGAARRGISDIPLEVIILFSAEAFYRCLALSAGEHLFFSRAEKKHVLAVSLVVIFLLLTGTAFYEVYQIFGYVF
ncbi:MAG: hypothetical protein FJW66_05435 [Actinobacteria bacterium]|nr:hypothetical protein [Actinomycetota bacterium]